MRVPTAEQIFPLADRKVVGSKGVIIRDKLKLHPRKTKHLRKDINLTSGIQNISTFHHTREWRLPHLFNRIFRHVQLGTTAVLMKKITI